MNALRRLMTVAIGAALAILAINALAIVVGVGVDLLVGGGHAHGGPSGLAAGTVVALRVFIWLLPVVAAVVFIGLLMGSEHPTAGRN